MAIHATGRCLAERASAALRHRPWAFEVVFVLGNVVLGSVGYLHVIMLLFLFEPAAIFVAAIQDATAGPTASRPD